MGSGKRPYRMGARAESTVATGERILDAAELSFFEGGGEEPTLADVAERSGVSVQTIMRRFGNRDGLLTAAIARMAAQVGEQRGSAPVGDPVGAVKNLVDHYEELGDKVVRMLEESARNTAIRQLTRMGFAYHREWCKRVFAPTLKALDRPERAVRTAQLVAVTDVYVWKLLRRDQGLGRGRTEQAMLGMVEPLTRVDR
ncbi:MAG TPA: TetR/AcrR family transcriptional regulator [Solirubrobacterales bacterium]|jgi:AcrR family transcriptional regulator|nr:TetR/AcrR family transcriptional regulator [Solirubrobacterales bacterium]